MPPAHGDTRPTGPNTKSTAVPYPPSTDRILTRPSARSNITPRQTPRLPLVMRISVTSSRSNITPRQTPCLPPVVRISVTSSRAALRAALSVQLSAARRASRADAPPGSATAAGRLGPTRRRARRHGSAPPPAERRAPPGARASALAVPRAAVNAGGLTRCCELPGSTGVRATSAGDDTSLSSTGDPGRDHVRLTGEERAARGPAAARSGRRCRPCSRRAGRRRRAGRG